MKKLLIKELRLAASPLSYIFLAGTLLVFAPGYPILVSAFFICFGVFHSFQNAREANDTLFTVLLPVKKSDFVRAKYAFTCFIQLLGFALCAAVTALRMTALAALPPYETNAMMNASPVFLAFVLLVFAAFNLLFVGGFFKTGYQLGVPFLLFGIAVVLLVAAAETLHHVPGLAFLNAPAGERLGVQFAALAAAAAVYAAVTALACRAAMRRFEKIDL